MRIHKIAILAIFAALAITVATAVAALHSQNQGSSSPARQQEANIEDSLPIADYETIAPSDSDERVKRHEKNKKYNKSRFNVSTFLTGKQGVVFNDWEEGLDSALPTVQSTAIIIGEVADTKAYVSEDRTGVYSEFTIQINEILKNDSNLPLAVGGSFEAERQGGRVRAPFGHTVCFFVAGQGVPRVRQKYVFFLGRNPREEVNINPPIQRDMSRNILTAYELRGGQVFPLDSAGGRDFKIYAGMAETTFLTGLRKTITSPSQVIPK
ncbi:MAG: hypothetical protein ABR577_15275 [Pyrinomonadaceae bacterium]